MLHLNSGMFGQNGEDSAPHNEMESLLRQRLVSELAQQPEWVR
jgi:hypothetical protein